jgi:hypothetical protein
LTATTVSVSAILIQGIVVGRPDLPQLGKHLQFCLLIVAPFVGLTVGIIAAGVGAIVGATNALLDSSALAGLEWTPIAALGTGVGIGLYYVRIEVVLLGFALGGVIGGSVGCLAWLRRTSLKFGPFTLRSAGIYAAAFVLIVAYVFITASWVCAFPGG